MPVINKIQVRRDSEADWASANPTLSQGEPGFETDTGKFKWGDGTTAWNDLDYAAGSASVVVSETAPVDVELGGIWYNSAEGRAYIYYDSYFVELTPSITGAAGKFTVSATPPTSPTPASGDGWFNSDTARLFIRYDNFWIEATSNYIGPTGPTGPTGPAGPAVTSMNASAIVTTVSDKSANYTLQSSDENTYIRSTGSAITITVPDVLANGESVNFIQAGAGQVTFAGSGVTINSADAKLKTNKQFSGATITKLGGAYYLVGDLGA
jgi:hypothetical protein